jgi:hypothetical protein
LFYDAVIISYYIALNVKTIDKQLIGKNVEGGVHGLIEVLSGDYHAVTDENHEKTKSGYTALNPRR